jgi:hypothetical protein
LSEASRVLKRVARALEYGRIARARTDLLAIVDELDSLAESCRAEHREASSSGDLEPLPPHVDT